MTMQIRTRPVRPTRFPRRLSPIPSRRARGRALRGRAEQPVPQVPASPRSLLERLAAMLADEGATVRGAFARHEGAGVPAPPPPPASAVEAFTARFELPMTDNDGRPFPASVLLPLLRDLLERMGGATFSEAVGVWRDRQGASYFDLVVAVEVWTHDRTSLHDFVRRARLVLEQDEIAIRTTSPEFVRVGRAGDVP